MIFVFRPEEYKKKVSEYVRKYASEEALRQAEATAVSSSSESSMSDFSEDEAQVCIFKNLGILKKLNICHVNSVSHNSDMLFYWSHIW